jgi:hypothetical protein
MSDPDLRNLFAYILSKPVPKTQTRTGTDQ